MALAPKTFVALEALGQVTKQFVRRDEPFLFSQAVRSSMDELNYHEHNNSLEVLSSIPVDSELPVAIDSQEPFPADAAGEFS